MPTAQDSFPAMFAGAGPMVRPDRIAWIRRRWPLCVGVALIAAPTLISLARDYWATDAGAHGPIILTTGLWLLARRSASLTHARRAPTAVALALLAPSLLLYGFGRAVGVLGIEALALYAALVALLYAQAGGAAVRALWFPLAYLLFAAPLPDTLVAAVTQPLKLGISAAAAEVLNGLGYPIVNAGVTLQVAQYELLVAAACSGLNSFISLSAIGLFYAYVLYNSSWRYMALLTAALLPIVMLANFARVLALILITYHLGDQAAQSYLHGFAGLTTTVLATLGLFAVDRAMAPVRRRLSGMPHAA